MSTQERPKDKKDAKQKSKDNSSSIDDWLDNFDTDQSEKSSDTSQSQSQTVSEPEQVSMSQKITADKVEELLATFTRRLPSWINKPWMYVKPTHEGHYKNWIESWKKVILDYSEILTKHIVNIYDLQEIHPFTHATSGKDLSIDELKTLIEAMVNQNLAKWLDDSRARIYFKTDEEWASILYQFMLDNGYATDIMTMYELANLKEKWSRLPDSELALILDILVDQDKAAWIGSERDTIQFKL